MSKLLYQFKLNRIAHIADVHAPRPVTRHEEYEDVFGQVEKSLEDESPDLILIAGDLYDAKLAVTNELNLLISGFLYKLAAIAPLVITRGNHDFNAQVPDRPDSIRAVLEAMQHPNISYYDKTGFYRKENLFFAVWHHGDDYSPWGELELTPEKRNPNFICEDLIKACKHHKTNLEGLRQLGYRFIDVFHDPVGGARLTNGHQFPEGQYLSPKEFKGDVAMLGDIHERQVFQSGPRLALPQIVL